MDTAIKNYQFINTILKQKMNLYPHFLVHGAFGAAIMVGLVLIGRTSVPRWQIVAMTIYGFVLGILPDAGQFWGMYSIYHSGNPWYFMIQPPFAAHIFYDSWLHPQGDWWNNAWYIEIETWSISAFILGFAYRKTKE